MVVLPAKFLVPPTTDTKKQILSAKVECVDAVFELALKKLCEMDEQKQTEFVLRTLEKYAEKGDVVVLSANSKVDRATLQNSATFNNLGLSFGKDGEFAGGVILCGSKFDKRLTFEELLQEERSVLQGEIFARLVKV